MVYDEEQGLIYFKEGFTVTRDSRTLTGEHLVFSTATAKAVARGHLTLEDSHLKLTGERLVMRLDSEQAHWTHGASGRMKDSFWRFRAKELTGTQQVYEARSVVFTSCDREHPDYHIRALRGKIYPGSHAQFTHAVFFIGPVPLWYWPFYSKSIGKHWRPTVYLDPGSGTREGKYLRSAIAFPWLNERLYTKLYLDWYEKISLGIGPEILYRPTEDRRLALYTYTIKEPNGLRQWDMRGDGYYQISSSLYSQGTFRYQRDPNFNNFYAKENPERVDPDLKSSFALNWRRSYWQARVLYDDTWGFDTLSGRFRSVEQTLPGFEGLMYPASLFGSSFFLSGGAGFRLRRTAALNTQDLAFERWDDSGSLTLERPWRLPYVRMITGSMGLQAVHNYVSKTDKTNNESLSHSRYGGVATMRFYPGSALDLTMTYSQLWRTQKNSLRQETQAEDRGVDSKRLDATNISRLPFSSILFLRSSYRFPTIPGTKLVHWTERLDPVFGSMTAPLPGGSFAVTTAYEVFNRKYVHSVSAGRFFGPANLTTSFVYDNRKPNEAVPALITHFPLPGILSEAQMTWRGLYRSPGNHLSSKREKFELIEREIILVPDFHDFLVTLTFRTRKQVREFFFTIRLKTKEEDRHRRLRRRLGEQDFYPWRQ